MRARLTGKRGGPRLAIGLLTVAVPAVTAAIAETPAPPVLYTPEADPFFAEPYIDVDEWRDAPVRHRYVHGGFRGTETRFSVYLPPKNAYHGRFFQHVTPVPGSENDAQHAPAGEANKIGSAFESGAYFLETNGGGSIDLTKGSLALADPTITAFKANAAAAQFSRKIAIEMYGGKRPYGYVYGGSGGAFRVIGQMESTRGVWDGAVPYVLGTPMAIPNMFTPRIQALRVLRNSFPRIVDAMEPGGNGDVYKGLNARETAVLREAELMGFPMTSWFGYRTMGLHGFAALYGGVAAADPTYFQDFWTKPGYLGHDHPEYFAADRIQYRAKVAQVITAGMAGRGPDSAGTSREEGGVDHAFKGERVNADKVVAFRLATNPPPVYFLGGDLLIRDGEAAGKRLMASTLDGDVVTLGVIDPALAARVKPGDEVEIDNSNFLAMETYHRHQVPGPDYAVWNQFRTPDGTPVYPQRSALLGPIFLNATAGSLETGAFEGKMIAVASLWDREAFPWQADWYRQRVRANLGGRTDDSFRLWYTDHALHGDAQPVAAPDRIVSYIPVLQQALRDLAAWVEQGVEPPATTGYKVADGKVIVPAAAEARRGIQPVVSLRVNGGERVEVGVGQVVRLQGCIEVPPGAGSVVAAEWDLDGSGSFATRSPIPKHSGAVTVTTTVHFDKPGTYFAGLRGTSQREGDVASTYRRIQNIERVRVVVR